MRQARIVQGLVQDLRERLIQPLFLRGAQQRAAGQGAFRAFEHVDLIAAAAALAIPTLADARPMTAEDLHLMHRLGEFGFSADNVKFDLAKIVDRSRKVAAQLSNGLTGRTQADATAQGVPLSRQNSGPVFPPLSEAERQRCSPGEVLAGVEDAQVHAGLAGELFDERAVVMLPAFGGGE